MSASIVEPICDGDHKDNSWRIDEGRRVSPSENNCSQSQGNAQVSNKGKAVKALDRDEKKILSAFEAGKLKSR